jgi:hypothetical protein
MPVKFIVIAAILFLIIFFIASYTRIINIDSFIRRNDKPVDAKTIMVYNLDNRFATGRVGEGFIINGSKLRFFSSSVPPVVIALSELENGKYFFISDNTGKQFLLGTLTSLEVNDNSSFYVINPEPKDKITFKSSYSLLPYYYGFFILSPGPISRYYHYYFFKVEKPSGASIVLEWKFSTYKGPDGRLVPDLFGDNKEGLMKVLINQNSSF